MKQQLIFVYNANSDSFSSLIDFAHKIISPNTYNCNLCSLTYGNFSVKKEWKDFVQQLAIETIFLHKDEFEKLYQSQTNLPAVFIKEKDSLKEIISAEEINQCKNLFSLKELISSKLLLYAKHYHSNI